jgi:hypothetical protein
MTNLDLDHPHPMPAPLYDGDDDDVAYIIDLPSAEIRVLQDETPLDVRVLHGVLASWKQLRRPPTP